MEGINQDVKFDVTIDYCTTWCYMKYVNMIKKEISNVYP